MQAAKVAETLDKRAKVREKQYIKQTGATSLPPAWFTVRAPDGLLGPRGPLPRFRSALCCLPPVGSRCRAVGETGWGSTLMLRLVPV